MTHKIVENQPRKSAVLYDIGGWFLLSLLFGMCFIGIALDYFWNFLVLFITCRLRRIDIQLKKKLIYTFIVTACGLVIDWLYYKFTWGVSVIGFIHIGSAFPRHVEQPLLELLTIIIPLAAIAVVNYFISRLYLGTKVKDSLWIGAAMGVFTAPWFIVAAMMLHW
jgi:hypothetical protein